MLLIKIKRNVILYQLFQFISIHLGTTRYIEIPLLEHYLYHFSELYKFQFKNNKIPLNFIQQTLEKYVEGITEVLLNISSLFFIN